jgi:hypothetical protein
MSDDFWTDLQAIDGLKGHKSSRYALKQLVAVADEAAAKFEV